MTIVISGLFSKPTISSYFSYAEKALFAIEKADLVQIL
jgi:hypothetical protein